MDWFWNTVLIVGVAGVVVSSLVAFQRHLAKPGGRTGTGGAAGIGLMESLFAPSSYEARIELERQGQMQAPAPVPGDPLRGLQVAVDEEGLPSRVVISANNSLP
ncbi:hypothetical protein MB46_17995 [Arthrobacter alpinus]|nr:hypothetical protein MB46_17995 [Arthrobacter alpinus]